MVNAEKCLEWKFSGPQDKVVNRLGRALRAISGVAPVANPGPRPQPERIGARLVKVAPAIRESAGYFAANAYKFLSLRM